MTSPAPVRFDVNDLEPVGGTLFRFDVLTGPRCDTARRLADTWRAHVAATLNAPATERDRVDTEYAAGLHRTTHPDVPHAWNT